MRSLAKSILRGSALAVVLPAVLTAWLQGKLLGADRVFPGWAQFFSLVPGMTGEYLRHAFYRCLAAQCDDDVCISFGSVASHPGIRLGQSAYIGSFCSLGNVTIEKDVLIASHVSVMNGCRQHGTSRLDIPIPTSGVTASSEQAHWCFNPFRTTRSRSAHPLVSSATAETRQRQKPNRSAIRNLPFFAEVR